MLIKSTIWSAFRIHGNEVITPISQSQARGPEATPAGKVLGSQKDQPYFDPVKFGFDYRRVVGMMMYLINTRPNLQVAVHQCAHFSHDPREPHGKALRHIARYIKET